MKILNLVYPEKSDVQYKISKFPDGQQQVNILEEKSYKKDYSDSIRNPSKIETTIPLLSEYIQIKARLNNFRDLELICCTVASLKELGINHIELYVPYILGARSDRKFEEGGNNYLKDVICPIINSLDFRSVICIDPHSDVLEACIKNFKKESNFKLVEYFLSESDKIDLGSVLEDFILVSPDAGASKKIYKIASEIDYIGEIITCSKDRDNEGKLTKCTVPWKIDEATKDLVIIDDICDGGRTFINIIEAARDEGYIGKAYLIVTHGVFSKGFEELNKYFEEIYCTNSFRDLNPYDLSNLGNKPLGKFVKQLNIF